MRTKNTRRSEDVEARGVEQAQEYFLQLRGEYERLRPEELISPRLEIGRAAGIALAAAPAIRVHLREMKRQLPEFDHDCVEALEATALAAWYAHAVAAPADADPGQVKALVDKALVVRRELMIQAESLAARKLLDPARLAEIREGRGTVDLAQDLVAIQAMFLERWDQVKNKTPVTEEELAEAAELGTKVMRSLGVRERPAKVEGEMDSAELRIRAFTLLHKRYDEIRRALTFLRWHEGDLDEIAPSLYSGSRGGRRSPPTDAADDDPETTVDLGPRPQPDPVDGAPADAAPSAPNAPPIR